MALSRARDLFENPYAALHADEARLLGSLQLTPHSLDRVQLVCADAAAFDFEKHKVSFLFVANVLFSTALMDRVLSKAVLGPLKVLITLKPLAQVQATRFELQEVQTCCCIPASWCAVCTACIYKRV